MSSLVFSAVNGITSIASGVISLVSIPVYASIATVSTATTVCVKTTELALTPVTYPIEKAIDCYNKKSKEEKNEIELDDMNLVNVRL